MLSLKLYWKQKCHCTVDKVASVCVILKNANCCIYPSLHFKYLFFSDKFVSWYVITSQWTKLFLHVTEKWIQK